MSLADAAAFLASEWPVFPCDAHKRPLTARGLYDATRDPEQARRMFQHPAAALIGVPMGEAVGLFTVDLDTKRGAPGLEWLAANANRLPRTRTHATPSGGRHLLFSWPTGRILKNSVNKLAPGVDIRAAGGYVCAPPSQGYEILDDAMPATAPGWLLDLIDPPAPPPQVAVAYSPPSTRIPDRYAEAALDRECEAVATAPEGARNHTLNVAAVKLGGLVAAGALSEATVRQELRRAAMHAGLDPRETDLTIQSGLTFGMTQPRAVPERSGVSAYSPPRRRLPDNPDKPDNPDMQTDTGRPVGLPLIYFQDIQPSISGADFVEGLLIEGAMTVVYGPSNCGKTFFCTDLALHVATGRKWRGREIDPGGVIYCALEGSHGISNRVAAFRKRHGLDGFEVPFAIIPVSLDLLNPDADTSRLIAAIQAAAAMFAMPVKLVVLDTLSRAMSGGNENSPEDMGALVSNGDRVRQATGAHVLWVHHSGKDQAQGARGHSLLRAATDTEIEISRPDKDSPSTARVTKQRELEIDGTWTFALERVELGTDRRGKPVASCVVTDAEPTTTTGKVSLSGGEYAGKRALIEALAGHGQTPPDSPDIPNSVRVVCTLSAWRREFYGRSTLDSQEAKQKAFKRASAALAAKGVVGVWNDVVWLADDDR